MIANYDIEAMEKIQTSIKNDISQNIAQSVNRIKKAVSNIQDEMIISKNKVNVTDKNLKEKISKLVEEIKKVMDEIKKLDKRLKELRVPEVKERKPGQTETEIDDPDKELRDQFTQGRFVLYDKLKLLEDALDKCKSIKNTCEDYMDRVDVYVADASTALNKLDILYRKTDEKIEQLCVKINEAKEKLFEYQQIYPYINCDQFRQRRKTKTGLFVTEKVTDYKKHLLKSTYGLDETINEIIKFHKSFEGWEDINFEKTQTILEHTGTIINSMKESLKENSHVLDSQIAKIEEYLSYAKKIK